MKFLMKYYPGEGIFELDLKREIMVIGELKREEEAKIKCLKPYEGQICLLEQISLRNNEEKWLVLYA